MITQKEFEAKVENYLKNNGVKEMPTNNKDKLELLKKIVFSTKVSVDCIDLEHAKKLAEGIKDEGYLENVQNLELNISNGLYYISNVRGILKEERKLERKAKIKRIFKIK